jgi:hypothetical protein
MSYTTNKVQKYKDVHRQTSLLGSKEVGDCAAHHPISDGRGHALLANQFRLIRGLRDSRRISLPGERHMTEVELGEERAVLFCKSALV